MITEKPEVISVSMGEELYEEYILDGMVGTLHFNIDGWDNSAYGFNDDLMVKKELNEVLRSINITTLINTEDRALLSMVAGELDKGLDDLECGMIQSCGTEKWVSVGGIRNDEGGGKFMTEYLIEKLSWDRIEWLDWYVLWKN